jgi:hypothetical protein
MVEKDRLKLIVYAVIAVLGVTIILIISSVGYIDYYEVRV